ncbi:MAG: hypothetical protein ABR599_08710 [Gemmatimonadota bacterium]
MLLDLAPLVLVLIAGAGLGAVLRRRLPALEAFPLAAGALVALLAAISLLATRMGAFHPWTAAIACASLLGCATAALRRRWSAVEAGAVAAPGASPPSILTPRREALLLGALLASLAALYGLFPIYFLLGGQDAGLYLVFAARIARTGELVLDQPFLRELNDVFGDAVSLGYPGIYSAFSAGLSDDPAELIPQFQHLFPALLANVWDALGIEGLVRVNAVLAVLGLSAFHAFARRLAGPAVALMATLLLGINPAMIWHARSSLTEPLLFLVTFTGLLLLDLAWERKSAAAAAAAGATLGLGVLDRLDGGIAVVVVAAAIAALLFARVGERSVIRGTRARSAPAAAAAALLAGYVVVAALGALDGWLHARPYLVAAWKAEAGKGLLVLNVGLALAAGAAVVELRKHRRFRVAGTLRTSSAVLLAGGLGMWLGYGYLARPGSVESAAPRAVVELSWYVTPVALALAVAGLAWAIRDESWRRWGGWVALAGFATLLFTGRLLIEAHHPWAARRWIAQVFPAVAFFSAYAIVHVHRVARGVRAVAAQDRRPARRRPSAPARARWPVRWAPTTAAALGLAFVLLYGANAVRFAGPYLFQPLLRDMAGDYRRLAEQRSSETLGLTWNQQIASVLTYLYDRPTVHVTRYERGMEDFAIVGALPTKSWGRVLRLRQLGSGWVCGNYVVEDERRRPDELVERCYDGSPYDLDVLPAGSGNPLPPGPRILLRAGSSIFDLGAAERDEESRVWSTGAGGWILRGPGVQLGPGRYAAFWSGHLESSAHVGPEARFEVRAGAEGEVLARASLDEAPAGPFRVELAFALPKQRSGVEFPVWVPASVRLRLDEFRLGPASPAGALTP